MVQGRRRRHARTWTAAEPLVCYNENDIGRVGELEVPLAADGFGLRRGGAAKKYFGKARARRASGA